MGLFSRRHRAERRKPRTPAGHQHNQPAPGSTLSLASFFSSMSASDDSATGRDHDSSAGMDSGSSYNDSPLTDGGSPYGSSSGYDTSSSGSSYDSGAGTFDASNSFWPT